MTKEKVGRHRRDRIAQMRAEQRASERRAAVVMRGIGGLVILLLVGSVGFYIVRQEMDKSEAEKVATAAARGDAAEDQELSTRARAHQTKVAYRVPPVGGEHNPTWQTCGIYDQPINNENAVHSMEHGAVWITYRPTCRPCRDRRKLKAMAGEPYSCSALTPFNLLSKIVASSWNHRSRSTARRPRPECAFILEVPPGRGHPELGASCDGPDRPAADAPLAAGHGSAPPLRRRRARPWAATRPPSNN